MSATVLDVSQAPSNQPNILDNAGFEIWQRGTTFTNPVANQYTADRWLVNRNGAAASTVSQESSIVDSGTYSAKVNITSVGGTTIYELEQNVEDFVSLRGKTISLSIRVWASVANIAVTVDDGITTTTSSTHPGDSAWHTLTVTATVSSSASRFIILCGFRVAPPVVTIFYVDSAMLVIGANPAVFTPVHPQVDLARCMRFFQTYGNTDGSIGTLQCVSTNQGTGAFPFKVPMRVAPTITVNNTSGFLVTTAANAGNTLTSLTFDLISINFARALFTAGTSNLVAGNATQLQPTTSTAIISLSADL